MDGLIIKGILTEKLNPQEGVSKDGRGWKKQNFIINTGAKFNAEICFQVFGEERIQMLNSFNVDEAIEVYFNLYSKEFNDRYFHNIDAWKIIKSKESSLENDLEENGAPF